MRGGRRDNSLQDGSAVHCRALARRGALRVRHRRPARAGFRPELLQTEQRSRRSFACSHGALCFWLPGCCAVTAASSATAPAQATCARRIATRSAPKLRHKQRQPAVRSPPAHGIRKKRHSRRDAASGGFLACSGRSAPSADHFSSCTFGFPPAATPPWTRHVHAPVTAPPTICLFSPSQYRQHLTLGRGRVQARPPPRPTRPTSATGEPVYRPDRALV